MNGTSVLSLKYCLTDAYRNQTFIETGVRLEYKQSCELDMAEATQGQRAAIMRATGGATKLEWDRINTYPAFDGEPSVAELAGAADRYMDEKDAKQRMEIEKTAGEKTKRILEELEKRTYPRPNYLLMESRDLRDAERLGVDLTEYNQALASYDEILPELAAQKAEFDQRLRLEKEESERKREAEKAAAELEKLEWIDRHGSDYLKRARLQHQYDCQRPYVFERAALEAPGYTVDWHDGAEWKSRSCPSVAALDELETMQAKNIGDVMIVWLTAPAKPERDNAGDDDYDYEPFLPSEAVAVRNYLGKYDLVKIL